MLPVLRCLTTLAIAVLLTACVALSQNDNRQTSLAYTDTDNTAIGRALREKLLANPDKSGFYLLGNGLDAFAARAILAASAERSIDAQYYLFHDDLVGGLLIKTLLQAADRGVRVRLLLDDMALNSDKDAGVAALDAHPGIQVRVFNPFARGGARWLQFVTRFDAVSRRMHNKSFTVDNQLSVLGGRNIGNEYFDADPELEFGDLDVLTAGPAVGQVSMSFDEYWNSPLSYPVATLLGSTPDREALAALRQSLASIDGNPRAEAYLSALRDSNLVEKIAADSLLFDWGDAKVFADDPAKIAESRDRTDLQLVSRLQAEGTQAQSELIVFSPYFVPGKHGVESFRQLREQGVRVRILTNSLASTDVSVVHSGYAKYRRYLLRAGVELYEVDAVLTAEQRRSKRGLGGSSKASLHAKSFVIDRQAVFIGSLNLDPRSVVENTEIGVLIQSPRIAGQMSDWFDQNIAKTAFRLALETNQRGEEIIVWYRATDDGETRFVTEPNAGFWRRFAASFLQLLPLDSLL